MSLRLVAVLLTESVDSPRSVSASQSGEVLLFSALEPTAGFSGVDAIVSLTGVEGIAATGRVIALRVGTNYS